MSVDEIHFGVAVRPQVRIIPKNETPQSKMRRVMSAGFREFAREYPTEALEIVRQEILDRRK